MKIKLFFIPALLYVLTITFFGYSCAYNHLPKKINLVDKDSLKQGIWLISNIEDNEERIILQHYKNNVLDGDYREFFPDGVLGAKGRYKNGIRVGQWDFYLKNGTLIRWLVYDKNGVLLTVGRVNPHW